MTSQKVYEKLALKKKEIMKGGQGGCSPWGASPFGGERGSLS